MLAISRIQTLECELEAEFNYVKAVLSEFEKTEGTPLEVNVQYYKGIEEALAYALRIYRMAFESELSIDL